MPPDNTSTNRRYGPEVLAAIEAMLGHLRQELVRLNYLAGSDESGYERSKELALFEQAVRRAAVELVAPELDTIAGLVDEYQRSAGVGPAPAVPAPPKSPRFLPANDGDNKGVSSIGAASSVEDVTGGGDVSTTMAWPADVSDNPPSDIHSS